MKNLLDQLFDLMIISGIIFFIYLTYRKIKNKFTNSNINDHVKKREEKKKLITLNKIKIASNK